mgnify:CR=1 FL=1
MTRKPTITEGRQALLVKAEGAITTARDALQALFDDLDEKRSKMEEHPRGTGQYTRIEEACNALEDAIEALGGIETGIELP